MLKYMGLVHQGGGFYFDEKNVKGKVKISQLITDGPAVDLGVFGFEDSEFYKVLEKGHYEFEVSVDGVAGTKSYNVNVDQFINTNGNFFKAE